MNGRIREYTREECPICGHRDWCGRREDGLVLCRRPPTPREVPGLTFKGMAKDGTTGMYVEFGRGFARPQTVRPAGNAEGAEGARVDARPREVPAPSAGSCSGDRVEPQWLTEDYPRLVASLTDERRAVLATALGLPASALDSIHVGWWSERRWWNLETQQHEGEPGCWTFPEYDAHDRVIGLGLRWPAGRKGQLAGGRRGLILPTGWRELPDPVLIVEGPSDVLAGRAIGLNVIGRPSNSGGAELLPQVCRHRRVIVLGENDRKLDRRWPGKEGAEAVAGRLSEAWGWPVPVAYAPEAQKDLRAWVVAQLDSLGREVGEAALAELRARLLTAVTPGPLLLHAEKRSRRGGKAAVRVFRWSDLPEGGPFFSDKLDLDSAKARARFASAVAELDGAVDPAVLQNQLLHLRVPEAPTQNEMQRRASQLPMPQNSPPAAESHSRPRIQANERQLREMRVDALAALAASNDPPRLFARSGGIARVSLIEDDPDQAVPLIQQLDPDALRGELTNAADWLTLHHSRERGDYLLPDLPPLADARDLLALPAIDLPPLAGIVTCPTFTTDGSLIVAGGYDHASGLWHHRTLPDLPAVPEHPTRDEITAARDTLADIIADFPFVDDAGRANATALMLLPFVRPLIDGPTPLHAVDAPTPGTGKGLLVQACLWPALGCSLDIRSGARDPDEWRKRITSELVAGKQAVGFDNATTRLDLEHLAAALTATLWTDRVLGQTRVVTIPNRSVWVCTGNNLAFSKKLARRVVWIRLDAQVEAPEQRTGFRYPNLVAHVREHRPALVAAALTLCRAWLDAGRPAGKQVMGSFENYAAVLGGILDVAGIGGFLANADELRRQADTETSEWRGLIQAWWERWHDAWVGVSDLTELLWDTDGKRTDLLPTVVRSETQRGAVTQLGMRLSAKRNCIIDGLRVTVGPRPDHAGRLAYRLMQTSGDEPPKVCERSAPRSASLTTALGESYDDPQTFADLPATPTLYAGGNKSPAHTQRESILPPALRGMQERSAKVCKSLQGTTVQEVAVADLAADLPQRSENVCVQPASGPLPARDDLEHDGAAHWLTSNAEDVPPTVAELAEYRDGWTPAAWRDRLLYLADRCADLNPERAAELRMAAAVMTHEEQGGCDVPRDA
jgi:hypothetical protein